MITRALIGFLLLWQGITPSVAQVTARHSLEAFLADLSTFTAEFVQRVYDETGQPLEESRGTLWLARPDKFRWNYLTPFKQTIVSDGKKLWLYDEELAQISVSKFDASAGSAAQLLGAEVDLDANYEVTETGQRDGAQWLQLVPKAASQQYTKAELGFAGDTLRLMRLRDNLGQVTELEFSGIERNPALEPSRFALEIPAGVDVIDGDVTTP